MRYPRSLALVATIGQLAAAQVPAARVDSTALSLDEAITIARRNNPSFLQTANGRRNADAQVRTAYGTLLPSSNASFSSRYQQGGQQVFNGLSFINSSDVLASSYSLGLNYSINAGAPAALKAALANRDAVDADVTGASELLRGSVTQQYIVVLQAQAKASLEDTLVTVAQGQLDLAKAKTAVGAGTLLDIRRAEVALGQAQVAALTAHNDAEVQMLRLYQQLGIAQPPAVKLTTQFAVAQPDFTLESVLATARQQNPAVIALRKRERASGMNVRVAQSYYTPTLSLSTGWGGQAFEYTNSDFLVQQAQGSAFGQRASCFTTDSIRTRLGMNSISATCDGIQFTPQMAQDIRDRNNQFPFRFTRSPFAVSAMLSIPLFDNFNREQRVETAEVDRSNAQYTTKARELQLTADVTQAYLNLTTAARTVALQEQNAAKAKEELAYAEERYKVGAATFLDVTTSRGTYEQAQLDRINSIYDYHKAYAALESAVGRPLR